MTLPVVAILLDEVDLSGQPLAQGYAEFTAPVRLIDAGEGADIFRVPVRGQLGSQRAVQIVPTDAPGPRPAGWTCHVEFRNVPGAPEPYDFFAPAGPCPVTVAAGSPAVATWTPPEAFSSAGLVPLPDGTAVTLSGITGLTPGVTYWVTGTSADTFSLATLPGGAPLPLVAGSSGTLTVTQYRLSALSPAAQVSPSAAFAQLGGDLSGAPAQVTSLQGTPVQPSPGGTDSYLRADGEWASPAAGADKNYVQSFSVASIVDVPHNLAKYPSVTVIDSAGDQVDGDVIYADINNLTLTFSAPFSGTVTCN